MFIQYYSLDEFLIVIILGSIRLVSTIVSFEINLFSLVFKLMITNLQFYYIRYI